MCLCIWCFVFVRFAYYGWCLFWLSVDYLFVFCLLFCCYCYLLLLMWLGVSGVDWSVVGDCGCYVFVDCFLGCLFECALFVVVFGCLWFLIYWFELLVCDVFDCVIVWNCFGCLCLDCLFLGWIGGVVVRLFCGCRFMFEFCLFVIWLFV